MSVVRGGVDSVQVLIGWVLIGWVGGDIKAILIWCVLFSGCVIRGCVISRDVPLDCRLPIIRGCVV